MRKVIYAVRSLFKTIGLTTKIVVLVISSIDWGKKELEEEMIEDYEEMMKEGATNEDWENFYLNWGEELGEKRMRKALAKVGCTM